MIDIEFKNGILIYNGIPLNLYGVLGLFKMVNYAHNPSVWSSGLTETGVEYDVDYTVYLKVNNIKYGFNKSDLFLIRDWLRENDEEWYESLPNITSEIKE